jgi:hypothetical protein
MIIILVAICPTWFVCNAKNRCQCNKITSQIVRDDEVQVAAVLSCNCVTTAKVN